MLLPANVGVEFPNCSEASQFFFKLARGLFCLIKPKISTRRHQNRQHNVFSSQLKATIRNSGASEQFESSRCNQNIQYLGLHPSLQQWVEIQFYLVIILISD